MLPKLVPQGRSGCELSPLLSRLAPRRSRSCPQPHARARHLLTPQLGTAKPRAAAGTPPPPRPAGACSTVVAGGGRGERGCRRLSFLRWVFFLPFCSPRCCPQAVVGLRDEEVAWENAPRPESGVTCLLSQQRRALPRRWWWWWLVFVWGRKGAEPSVCTHRQLGLELIPKLHRARFKALQKPRP